MGTEGAPITPGPVNDEGPLVEGEGMVSPVPAGDHAPAACGTGRRSAKHRPYPVTPVERLVGFESWEGQPPEHVG